MWEGFRWMLEVRRGEPPERLLVLWGAWLARSTVPPDRPDTRDKSFKIGRVLALSCLPVAERGPTVAATVTPQSQGNNKINEHRIRRAASSEHHKQDTLQTIFWGRPTPRWGRKCTRDAANNVHLIESNSSMEDATCLRAEKVSTPYAGPSSLTITPITGSSCRGKTETTPP